MIEWVLGHPPTKLNEDQRHWPIIQTQRLLDPKDPQYLQVIEEWEQATQILWTSRQAVIVWKDLLIQRPSKKERAFTDAHLHHWCVGNGTAALLRQYGIKSIHVANEATAEGLLEILLAQDLSKEHLFWLHAQGARSVLQEGLQGASRKFFEHTIYETIPSSGASPPPWQSGDRLLFTSPSCVIAWKQLQWEWPKDVSICAIGPITLRALLEQNIQGVWQSAEIA